MTNMMKLKEKITLSNIFTALLAIFVLAMFISPEFKGMVSRNLMKIGLFQPKVPEGTTQTIAADVATSTQNQEILFKTPQGEIISLESQKGKVVFINFWATWCPPCIAEMPSINKLYTGFKGNDAITFMMVDVDNNREKSQKFMEKRDFDLPVYTPASGIPASYMSGAIPTTLVLNKQGQVAFKHEGMGDFSNEEFKNFLADLISE